MNAILDNDKSSKFNLQEARKNALNGQSPRARGHEKKIKCVEWLWRWGYSTSKILTKVSGAERNIIGTLMKANLIVRTEVGAYCKFYYTLSEKGVQLACEHMTKWTNHYKEIDPHKVNQYMINHNIYAQFATIEALKHKYIDDYETERMGYEGEKRPDVIWLFAGNRVGVEIELSAKFGRQLDDFVARCVSDLDFKKLNGILILSTSKSICTRYRERFTEGAPFVIWGKDKKGHWEIQQDQLNITEEISQKVKVFQIAHFDHEEFELHMKRGTAHGFYLATRMDS